MSLFVDQIKKTIRRYSLLKPGDRVVVAVSGGPDSVCLLAVLQELAPELDLALHVAHLDHMVRGEESAAEAVFVADLAKKLSVPSTIDHIDVPTYCAGRGLSLQAGAREARYGFLQRVMASQGATRIATGHTADDQAETVLLRLIRGAGISGLSGIPPVRDAVIRPLLDVTREDVIEYLKQRGLSFVSDPSNEKPVYARNRIRIELMQVLRRFNPRIVETLAREAAILRDEDQAADECLQRISGNVLQKSGETVAVDREMFVALPLAHKRRLIRQAVELFGTGPEILRSVLIEQAAAFAESARTGRSLELVPGLVLEREYGNLVIRQKAAPAPYAVVLEVPGKTVVRELGIEVELQVRGAEDAHTEVGNNERKGLAGEPIYFWQAMFDYDKIIGNLTLRSRQPGDRFCPFGMGGKSKKIQDLLVDAKVPLRERNRLPLLATDSDIIWVVGLRTDERYRVSADTGRVLVVGVKRASEY